MFKVVDGYISHVAFLLHVFITRYIREIKQAIAAICT